MSEEITLWCWFQGQILEAGVFSVFFIKIKLSDTIEDLAKSIKKIKRTVLLYQLLDFGSSKSLWMY